MVLLIGQASFVFAGNADDTDEKIAAIRKNATELLRETSAMTASINSPSNRINFTVSVADLLWNLDKAEANAMFNAAIEEVRKGILQIDAEMNFAIGNGIPTSINSNTRGRNSDKINQVLTWRSTIVNSLSNRDPEWALRFVNEANQITTNLKFKKRIERSDKTLTSTLARKVAEQDKTKALEFGRESLSKGFSNDVVNMMQKIYAKDTEKSVKFGEEIIKKLDTTNLDRNSLWTLVRLFQFGLATSANTDKPPLFSNSSMQKLAEKLAVETVKPSNRYRSFPPQVMSGLEKYAPQNATQVKSVFEQRNSNRRTRRPEQVNGISSARTSWENSINSQSELRKSIQKINAQDTSIEEKTTLLNELQNKIMSNSNERWRFTNLVSLAATAKNIGETKKAMEILGDAEGLINRDPKVKSEFSDNRNLANAYAGIDPEKSFQILELIAYRLNGVIDGYIKFMEYSGNQRMVENGELVINSNSRQFTNYLSLTSDASRSLAEKDFNRLKDLSDKFERPEVRIAIRLMIARGLLNSNQNNFQRMQTIVRPMSRSVQ